MNDRSADDQTAESKTDLGPHAEPWWWDGCALQVFDGCGFGCLLILFFYPFLKLATSEEDGDFRISWADGIGLVALFFVLLAYEVQWAGQLNMLQQMGVSLLIGLTCGGVMAIFRLKILWLFVGLNMVPIWWLFAAVVRFYAGL